MKILIAEDNNTSRLLLGATLKKLGHEVVAMENGRKAWDAWQQGDFSLLISDWMMPDLNGLELCRLIRAEQRAKYTYIILLTALAGKGSYLEGMDSGADDFITKPFDGEQLAARLRVAERILDLHETLRVQAMHDRLTGLLNRAAIMDGLQTELDRAAREEACIGVVLADLDHFKSINDTHGHQTGDAVLRETAQRMQAAVRSYDKVGRYGGEEFLIVAPGCVLNNAAIVAERVRVFINRAPMETPCGMISVTSSLGVAVSQVGSTTSADALIGAADAALYRAKDGGRNRVEVVSQ